MPCGQSSELAGSSANFTPTYSSFTYLNSFLPFCLCFLNMELNIAQLLVHNDATMNKFRCYHGIPNNVLIERSRPNEDANVAEESGNHISVRTWLIHQASHRFLASPMLKEVMARCRLTFMQMSVNFV